MKIWLPGSKGLVGENLIPRLNHEVLATDRTIDVSTLSIEDDFPDVDLIINLAALNSSKESLENPQAYFNTNVKGNFNLLEIARVTGAKYMYLTSPKAEEHNPYGASKKCAEVWCETYRDAFNVPTIINRVGNLYGPGGDNFWVNIFMQKAKDNETIELWGNQSRDMLFIDDLIDLLVDQIDNFALYCKEIHPVGGGSNNLLTPEDLITWLKYDKVVRKPALTGLQSARVTDNTQVTSINGWKPKTDLATGLKQTYDSIRRS